MTHAQKPDFVFRRNGRFPLNRRGRQFSSTIGSRGVRISGSNAGYNMFWGRVQDYWLPTPFASFPFTSLPVRHRVPSHFNRSLPRQWRNGVFAGSLFLFKEANVWELDGARFWLWNGCGNTYHATLWSVRCAQFCGRNSTAEPRLPCWNAKKSERPPLMSPSQKTNAWIIVSYTTLPASQASGPCSQPKDDGKMEMAVKETAMIWLT